MRFRYIGDSTEMIAFGYDFAGGNEPEVTDAHAIGKLSGNRFFEAVGEATFDKDTAFNTPIAKNKGGRPRKIKAQPTEA
jgi:hypothetical protein